MLLLLTSVVTGSIEVHDANNGNLIGYINKNLGNGGAQFVYDPSIDNALIVTFPYVPGSTVVTLPEVSAINANPGTHPYVGLIQGRDDLDSVIASDSFKYVADTPSIALVSC